MSKSKQAAPRFLTELENNYLYIKKEYEQLAAFLEGKSSGEMHPDDDATVYEYGSLYSLMSIRQPASQEQMKYQCELIENRCKSRSTTDSIIHFERNVHIWNLETTSYGCGVCVLEVLGGTSESFDINVDTRLKLSIYIGETSAYIRAESEQGSSHYFMLNKFSMLYNEVGEPGYDMPFTEPGNGPARETGKRIVVVFDRVRKLSYTSDFPFHGTPEEAPSTDCEDSDKAESTADIKEEAS